MVVKTTSKSLTLLSTAGSASQVHSTFDTYLVQSLHTCCMESSRHATYVVLMLCSCKRTWFEIRIADVASARKCTVVVLDMSSVTQGCTTGQTMIAL